MKKCIVFLAALLFFSSPLFAQHYLELMQGEHVNFYEVQKAAEAYFSNKDKGKGSGYKQYKRWEYIHQKEIDDQGFLITGHQVQKEQDQFLQSWQQQSALFKGNTNKSLTGDWTTLGPVSWNRTSGWTPGVGRIVCIDLDDNNQNLIYVGAPTGGLWKTIDGGANWSVLTDDFPVMDIWSVEIDPTNSNIVYMGTNGGGILKTTDGGSTWNSTGFISGQIRGLLVSSSNNNVVFAAKSSGIYRSEDGGANWTLVSNTGAEDIMFKPGSTSVVYACAGEFQRSTDGGINWTSVTSGFVSSQRLKMAVTPANPNYVYLVQKSGSIFGQVYRSTNSGVSFSIRAQYNGVDNNYLGYLSDGTDNRGQAGRDMAISVSSTNANEVIIAGIIVFKSTDGGVNYTPLTEWFLPNPLGYVHADVEVLKTVGGKLYVGTDGGIYRSDDAGSTFIDLSTGIGIRQFYRIGCSQTDINLVSGGSQDNGTSVMRSVNRDWVDWLGGDGMETFVDYSNSNILYGTSQFGSMYKSINQGNSRSNISKPNGVGNGEWVTPFEIDPLNASTLYVGFDQVYKNTNGGSGTWSAISNFNIGNLNEIKLAPSDPDYIYVSDGTEMLMTSNGGSNWTAINEPWGGFVNYISVDPNNPQRVAVAISGSQKVFVTNNAGASWTNLTLNLPGIGSNCVVLDATAENGIYVGMQSGIYYKDDNLANWIPFFTDLPNVRVEELEIVAAAGKIRAGTYGRGLWESDIYSGNSANNPPLANFTANTTTIIAGQSVNFSDLSLGTPTTWAWSFAGGTPASSNAQNPSVTYNTGGSYAVSLTVTNGNGANTKTESNYITVSNYCIPDPTNGTGDGDFIDAVSLGAISNVGTGGTNGANYNDYTNLSTDLVLGAFETVQVTGGAFSPDYYAVWIDYNQDNDFTDPGEKLGELQSSASGQLLSFPFQVDAAAALGQTTMRVRCVWNASNMNPCTDYGYGETEDYSVVIVSTNNNCVPSYSIGTQDGDYIDGVVFGNMSNIGTGSSSGPSYTDYSNLVCEVEKGMSHTLSITSGAYSPDNYAAWIDFNQNGDFTDPGEKLGEFVSGSTFETQTINVNIPMNLDTGSYFMRVRCAYNQPNMSPCDPYTWGEAEDYSVRVLPSSDDCQLPNQAVALNDSLCGPGVMNLAVQGNANFYNWYSTSNSTEEFHRGSGFTTPMLSNTTTYYVASSNEDTANSLTTFYNADLQANGNVFDIKTSKRIELDGFSINLNSSAVPQEVKVFYKTGSYQGFEANASAWTLLGIDTVMGQGIDNPVYVDIGGLVLDKEQKVGILIHSAQGNFAYTSLPGDTLIANNDIYIRGGKGLGILFSEVFSPRMFNGTVHYTKYAGCESSRVPVIARVKALPQVQINPVNALCETDNAVNLQANPSGGNFSGSGVSGNQFDPQVAGNGTHDIIYQYTNSVGCSNADTIQVIVNAMPTVNLSPIATICENASPITLTGGTPTGGAYSGPGVSAGIFDPSLAGTGIKFISYTYTNSNGCTATAQTTLAVNPAPSVAMTGLSDICENESPLTLSIGSPMGGNYSGAGVTNGQFDPSLSGPGSYFISYNVVSPNGCSDMDSTSITVLAKPTASFDTLSAVCQGANAINLTGGLPSGGTYFGNGVSGGMFDPSQVNTGTDTIYYAFTAGNSCSDTATSSILVNAVPQVSLNAFGDLCENDQVIALAGGIPQGGVYSGTGVSGGQFDPAVSGIGSFLINYRFADGNGCFEDSAQLLTVNANPVADFTFISNPLLSVDFTNTTVSFDSVWWEFGDGLNTVSTQLNPTFVYASAGNYTVCLTTFLDGCQDSICQTISSVTSLSKNIGSGVINLFPNPFTDRIKYNISGLGEETIQFELITITGHIVQNGLIEIGHGSNEGEIIAKDLPAGSYLVRLSGDSWSRIFKMEQLR